MSKIADAIEKQEGRKRSLYKDSEGYWSIGVGFLVDPAAGGGLHDNEIDFIRDNRIKLATKALITRLPWTIKLNEARFFVLLSMAYQMGMDGLLAFKKALEAAENEHWATARVEMLDSKWAKQTPDRARVMAYQMETGEWQL